MTTPANEERIKELEEHKKKQKRNRNWDNVAHIQNIIDGIIQADAKAEKYYKQEHWEIKEVYRKQGWVFAIEWVKEQIEKLESCSIQDLFINKLDENELVNCDIGRRAVLFELKQILDAQTQGEVKA